MTYLVCIRLPGAALFHMLQTDEEKIHDSVSDHPPKPNRLFAPFRYFMKITE